MADINALSVLKGLLSKAYKLDDGKIAEIFDAENANEDSVITALLNEDAVRVSLLKKQNADNKESFNQGYAKAKKDERTLFENELKAEFGIESDTTGIDLVKAIVTSNATGGEGGSKEITEDDVKKHPAYQTMERNFKKQIADTKTDYEGKLTEVEKTAKRNETFYSVREKANGILETLNPIQAKNPTVANTIRSQFFNELKGYEYEQNADGSYTVTKDGKVLDDAHGHTRSFEDIVKNIAGSYYEFQENNGGSNAGNQNGGAGGAGAASKTFKSDKEAADFANDTNVPLADRMAALKAYNEGKAE